MRESEESIERPRGGQETEEREPSRLFLPASVVAFLVLGLTLTIFVSLTFQGALWLYIELYILLGGWGSSQPVLIVVLTVALAVSALVLVVLLGALAVGYASVFASKWISGERIHQRKARFVLQSLLIFVACLAVISSLLSIERSLGETGYPPLEFLSGSIQACRYLTTGIAGYLIPLKLPFLRDS